LRSSRSNPFNAAIADATEHWKWLHWDFDDTRPLRDFGWNKAIKPGASKRLVWISSWYWGGAYLDFDHSGGGAFVLTSALFADGSEWQDPGNGEACSFFWFKHKKSLIRPAQLPPREALRESD